ncbi:MAG TPA: alpha/beta hydrolase [Nevskiaceae bacterium]|nr:alpha/beta hydrolase [Nevskiaceae bacterium]
MTRADGRSVCLRTRGLRLHVRVYGPLDAPLLFLLHGWLDASASFAPLIAALRAETGDPLCVIAPDQRGFGYSQGAGATYWFPDYIADLDAVVNHFAADRDVLMAGHSMGAQVASLYAGLRPHRVQRLALLDGLAVPDMPAATAPRRYAAWLDPLGTPAVARSYPDFTALEARIAAHHPGFGPHQAGLLAHAWAAPDGNGRVRLLADPTHRRDGPLVYHSADAETVWRCVTAPTLFLLAGKSPFRESLGRAEYARRMACFAKHEDCVLEGVGHLMHVEAPRRCAAILAKFFRGARLCG